MGRVSPQLIVFSYHKTGTSLLLHVMTKVGERLGLTVETKFGMVAGLDPQPDIVLVPHSLLQAPPNYPYRAIRMIRDPRDIWVSGYLYHRHSEEEWCISTNFDLTPPIVWPRVDYSFAHLSEEWKRRYLERLEGKTYQRNVRDRALVDGLDFELEGYTGCTLETMRQWTLCQVDALDVKLEDTMADFDGTMRRIFGHFGFTMEQSDAALEVARSEDIRRMNEANIASRPQIHSREISKWRDVLSAAQVARFEALHGGLIQELGYELAGADPGFAYPGGADFLLTHAYDPPAIDVGKLTLTWGELALNCLVPCEPETAPSAPARVEGAYIDVWLSVDGVACRPAAFRDGTYSFVVPPGTRRVRLETRYAALVTSRASSLSDADEPGVRVSQIAIRSNAGEVVIPADDPRLGASRAVVGSPDLALSSRTDDSVEIPWAGVSGAVVVMVRCTGASHHPFGAGKVADGG
jgi:hypothetical protein